MTQLASIVAAAGIVLGSAHAETLTVPFTRPDGGVTTGTYDGTVLVTVTGTGQSDGSRFNDAFYLLSPPVHNSSYYQLTFGTSTLVGLDPAQDAFRDIVGGLPGYESTHDYSFLLNTGVTTPDRLHFGVSDGDFADNTGAYTITVTEAVPEPAAIVLSLLGIGLIGIARAGRRAD